MRIGLKFHLNHDSRPAYHELYGSWDVATYLKTSGVEAVEASLGPNTEAESVRRYGAACVLAGLRVSLHPYTEGHRYNPAFFEDRSGNPARELHARFFHWAHEIAAAQRAPVVVNIHAAAAAADEVSRAQQLAQSIAFFDWSQRWCAERTLVRGTTGDDCIGVVPVVELQIRPGPGEAMLRIGDNYRELLRIAQQAKVGVCWDFGHAVMNHLDYGDELEPPASLLPHVVHVHCHDVAVSAGVHVGTKGRRGDDHQPLRHGNVPWQRWLGALRAAGFDGTVLLEVLPEAFLEAGGLPALHQSLDALRAIR